MDKLIIADAVRATEAGAIAAPHETGGRNGTRLGGRNGLAGDQLVHLPIGPSGASAGSGDAR